MKPKHRIIALLLLAWVVLDCAFNGHPVLFLLCLFICMLIGMRIAKLYSNKL
jgi:hypothetical protein